jgi:Tfp pilus assembly protein PilF
MNMAIAKFEEALDSMPNNKNILAHLADLYHKVDKKKANQYYLQAITADPKATISILI